MNSESFSAREALKEGRVTNVYQAQLATENAIVADGTKIEAVESLARVHDGNEGMISPAVLIPSALREGVMNDVHKVLTQQAFAFANHHDVAVSINIEPSLLERKDFADEFMELIEAEGIDPTKLELELLETMPTDNAHKCRWLKQIEKLFGKKPVKSGAVLKGLRGVVDDLPRDNSYKMLSELRRLGRSDKVKIDFVLVKQLISSDPIARGQSRKHVRKILKAARTTGAKVVFEGVDPGQIDLIAAIEQIDEHPERTLLQMGNPEEEQVMHEILSGRRRIRAFGA